MADSDGTVLHPDCRGGYVSGICQNSELYAKKGDLYSI